MMSSMPHKLEQLKLYFKVVNKNLSEYFNTMPIVHNSDIQTVIIST